MRSRVASSRWRPRPASAAASASATSATGTSTPSVKRGDRVRAGQFIGWTTKGSWHVHLTEFHTTADGTTVLLNPLRPGGKLRPYADTAPPVIHDVRFYTPATPTWGRRVTGVAQMPAAGKRLDKSRLAGVVDIRARVSDPQSFIGWFKNVPLLAAPHHPYRLGLLLIERPSERVVLRRTVYIAAHQIPIATEQHYAPGTTQNHPASSPSTARSRARASTGSGSSRSRTGTRRD